MVRFFLGTFLCLSYCFATFAQATWQPISTGTTSSIMDVAPAMDGNTFKGHFALNTGASGYYNGSTWSSASYSAIYYSDAIAYYFSDAYLGGVAGGVYTPSISVCLNCASPNYSLLPIPGNSGDIADFTISGGSFFSLTSSGKLLYFDNGSWFLRSTLPSANVFPGYAIAANNTGKLYTVGDYQDMGGGVFNALVYISTDYGNTWNSPVMLPTNSGRMFEIAVHPTNPNIIYAVGRNGNLTTAVVYKSTNGGTNWQLSNSDASIATYWGIAFQGNTAWIVGDGGVIKKATIDITSGNTTPDSWQTQASGTTNTLYCIGFADADHAFIGGANGTLLKYENTVQHTISTNVSAATLGCASGTQGSVVVTSSTNWSLSGIPSWLSASTTSGGAGNTNVIFSANSSNPNSSSRFAVLTFSNGAATCTVTITQTSNSISVSQNSLSFVAANAPTQQVTVTNPCGGNFTVSPNAGWISVSPTNSGNSPETLTIGVSNNTGAARTGTITVTNAGGTSVTITINQDATTACSWIAAITVLTTINSATASASTSGNLFEYQVRPQNGVYGQVYTVTSVANIVLTGLLPSTEYCIKMRRRCSANNQWSGWSAEKCFTTQQLPSIISDSEVILQQPANSSSIKSLTTNYPNPVVSISGNPSWLQVTHTTMSNTNHTLTFEALTANNSIISQRTATVTVTLSAFGFTTTKNIVVKQQPLIPFINIGQQYQPAVCLNWKTRLWAPMAGVKGLPTYPKFEWEPTPPFFASQTVTYDLEVREAGTNNVVVSQQGITTTIFESPTQLSNNTDYQWRVRTLVNGTAAPWSDWRNFSVYPTPPASGYGAVQGKLFNVTVRNNSGATCSSCNGTNATCNDCNATAATCTSGCCSNLSGYITGMTWQCVEFVVRYYITNVGINLRCGGLYGNAKFFYYDALDAGLLRYANGSTTIIAPNDILVWGSNSGGPGHVAVVESVTVLASGDLSVKVYQQNAGSAYTKTFIFDKTTSGGWLAPNYNNGTDIRPCLGWVRATPKVTGINNGQVLLDLTPTLSWEYNSQNAYDLYVLEQNSNGCLDYTSVYTKKDILAANHTIPSGILQKGKKYLFRLNTKTPSGVASGKLVAFSTSPSAQRTANDIVAENMVIKTYRTNPLGLVGGVRVFHKKTATTNWSDLGFSSNRGYLLAQGINISVGDSLWATASGYEDAKMEITASMAGNASTSIMLQWLNAPDHITNAKAVLNNSPNRLFVDTESNVFRFSAENHTHYRFLLQSANDDGGNIGVWSAAFSATDDIQTLTLQEGENHISAMFFSPYDTSFVEKSIQYIPPTQVPTETYQVTILNTAGETVSMFIDGDLYDSFSDAEFNLLLPNGAHSFWFKRAGEQPYLETTVSDTTIVLPWQLSSNFVHSQQNENKFLIYPNPNTGFFTLEYQTDAALRIDVFNALGQLVHTEPFTANPMTINTQLPAGIYWLRAINKDGTQAFTEKVEISR